MDKSELPTFDLSNKFGCYITVLEEDFEKKNNFILDLLKTFGISTQNIDPSVGPGSIMYEFTLDKETDLKSINKIKEFIRSPEFKNKNADFPEIFVDKSNNKVVVTIWQQVRTVGCIRK